MSHFFENQKKAKAKSRNIVLVFLFFLALQFLAVYFLVHWGVSQNIRTRDFQVLPSQHGAVDHLALKSAVGFALLIAILFLYRRMSFFSNPASLPQQMGAKEVSSGAQSDEEQTYLNIVSEMSLASGVPMPKVYVLKHEQVINAFTSGYDHQNANIVVTQGALEKFTRDELQAVVAHEFGHIVSGDVRANINLLAVYFSFSSLYILGMRVFEVVARTGSHRRRSSKKNGGGQLMLVVVAIIVLGAVGAFVSRIVSASFSRQREYLADALSVQFTRYPAALASALAKIRDGGGSVLQDVRGAEVSAICFSSSLKWMSSVYDTHPSLNSRILKTDPKFISKGSSFKKRVIEAERRKENLKSDLNAEKSLQYLATMGLITETDIANAEETLKSLKSSKLNEYLSVQKIESLVYALLLDDADANHLEEQKNHLYLNVPKDVSHQSVLAHEILKDERSLHKTSIVELMIPMFGQLSATISMRLLDNAKHLIDLDNKQTAYESFLYLFIKKYGLGLKEVKGPPSVQEVAFLIGQMSALNSGGADVHKKSRMEALKVYFAEAVECDEVSFDVETVLCKLPNLALHDKERLVRALLKAITFDEHLNRKEFECFRIVCDALEVPAPPINI